MVLSQAPWHNTTVRRGITTNNTGGTRFARCQEQDVLAGLVTVKFSIDEIRAGACRTEAGVWNGIHTPDASAYLCHDGFLCFINMLFMSLTDINDDKDGSFTGALDSIAV